MELYWREVKRGLNLVVLTEEEDEFVVGGVRDRKRGIQAIANTRGYDPGRASDGFASLTEAKDFVENFKPWRDFFSEPLELQEEVRPQKMAE